MKNGLKISQLTNRFRRLAFEPPPKHPIDLLLNADHLLQLSCKNFPFPHHVDTLGRGGISYERGRDACRFA